MVFSCLKNDYLQVKGGLEGFPMMLVGNKCDEEAGGAGTNVKNIQFQANGKF